MIRVEKNKKIEIINSSNVLEVKGDNKVEHVILDKEFNGIKELKLDGLFIEIGHIPQTDLAKKIGVKLNDKGEIMIDKLSKTNVDGFYAAGDVGDNRFKQAITGSAEGVIAAFSANECITGNECNIYYENDKEK